MTYHDAWPTSSAYRQCLVSLGCFGGGGGGGGGDGRSMGVLIVPYT